MAQVSGRLRRTRNGLADEERVVSVCIADEPGTERRAGRAMIAPRSACIPHPERLADDTEDTRVAAAKRGDEAAWRDLFDEHYPRVHRFFRARVGSAEQAEDLASNVFLQAVRSINRFTWQGKPFAAWLFGIARHELASHYRSLRPADSLCDEMAGPAVCNEYLEVEIRDILERLPAHYRQALELRFVLGLGGAEAAEAMGRSHGSFRSLLLRATRAFRAACGEHSGSGSIDEHALAAS